MKTLLKNQLVTPQNFSGLPSFTSWMKKLLPLFLLTALCFRAAGEIDSLYNSRWKTGLKLSLIDQSNADASHLVLGIPFTRNLFHTSFNAESGFYIGGLNPFVCSAFINSGNAKLKRGYALALPVKFKYDWDGMFLSAGLNNWYWHTKYDGRDFWGEPLSFTTNSWIRTFNFSMGFEKALAPDKEIFVELFYERTLSADSDSPRFRLNENLLSVLGLSLGINIRGS